MMPIRMTAVLNDVLAGLLFMYLPLIRKNGRSQTIDLNPAMAAHAKPCVPGLVSASDSVGQNYGINHVYHAVTRIDIGLDYARVIYKDVSITNADLNISAIDRRR